jgi:hypothetical protein
MVCLLSYLEQFSLFYGINVNLVAILYINRWAALPRADLTSTPFRTKFHESITRKTVLL